MRITVFDPQTGTTSVYSAESLVLVSGEDVMVCAEDEATDVGTVCKLLSDTRDEILRSMN